ncbi:hypothetical protein [Streptomyces griseoloalbus]|uniref:DNA-binding IclR family transcriptional regulator n=1 Tax=Streptomyces griseoloalbus TaxID=67303 RepID=A0A7W8BU45_9ACTN|nr:hypothetical protein [Streptomyces albaduncus]MBB5128471.1 DNA-binding IclR family transcriptional regulator [Streptomyces albaduncus]GGW68143.1 hypothetical protein GCM10010340_52830 [Streptomyces albaduncus]
MTPAAATAIIRAAIEDAHLAEILNRPGMTAHRIAHALEAEGWTITRTTPPTGPQTPA